MGLWLAVGGLWLRLFGIPLAGEGLLGVWRWLPSELGLPIAGFGWPMIVVGTAWFGVLAGLWMRLGWSKRAALVLALASILHLGIGTLIGAISLACLSDRRLTSWLDLSTG